MNESMNYYQSVGQCDVINLCVVQNELEKSESTLFLANYLDDVFGPCFWKPTKRSQDS